MSHGDFNTELKQSDNESKEQQQQSVNSFKSELFLKCFENTMGADVGEFAVVVCSIIM